MGSKAKGSFPQRNINSQLNHSLHSEKKLKGTHTRLTAPYKSLSIVLKKKKVKRTTTSLPTMQEVGRLKH
jgi:hypothetical protein